MSKRGADVQISKEGLEGESSGDDSGAEGGGCRGDGFERASEDVLKGRKIAAIKPRAPVSAPAPSVASNPFAAAAAALAAPKSAAVPAAAAMTAKAKKLPPILTDDSALKVSWSIPSTSASAATPATAPSSSGSGFGGFAAYSKVNPFTAAAQGKGLGLSGTSSVSVSTGAGVTSSSSSSSSSATKGGASEMHSPKNPFSSPSPKHNPFIKIVKEDKKDDLWQCIAGAQVEGEDGNSGSGSAAAAGPFTFEDPLAAAATVAFEDPLAAAAAKAAMAGTVGGDRDGEGDEGEDASVEIDASASGVPPATAARFSGVKTHSGEEGESVCTSVRTKLYKLKKEEETADSHGAPSSSSSTATATAPGVTVVDESKKPMEWVEVGTGPIKVLQRTDDGSARMVMRREAHPGGPGIQLVLNVLLKGKCSVKKHSEKAVSLTCFEAGKLDSSNFLLKMKGARDVDDFVAVATKNMAA